MQAKKTQHSKGKALIQTTKYLFLSRLCFREGNGTPLQYSCLENPRDRVAWWAAVYGIALSRTRLKWLSSSSRLCLGFSGGSVIKNPLINAGDVGSQSLVWEDTLEKEIATHSSILAWEISWTEEPGRLQSMGLQRDMTNWVTLHFHMKRTKQNKTKKEQNRDPRCDFT